MTKVKRYKQQNATSSWRIHSTLSSSWIPLTFALLLYTSGIDLSIGESSSSSSNRNPPPGEEETESGNNGGDSPATPKKNYTLTGNPQIDYVHDPNLPHELNGYNLSDYPFFSRVPSRVNFSCKGLKDGFYSNIEHKCQVYHHCVSDARYDFLCANFTAFDQKTFICQFVNVVDCPNSALYWHRNDDLYWETKTTEAPPPIKIQRELYDRRRPPPRSSSRGGGADRDPSPPARDPVSAPAPAPAEDPGDPYYDSEEDYRPVRRKPLRRRCKNKRRCRNRRRRPRPRRPNPDYYDYDEEYEEEDYDDDDYDEYDRPKQGNRGGGRRRKDKTGNRVAGSKVEEAVVTTERPRARGTTTPEPKTTPPPPTTSTPSPFEEVAEQERLDQEQSKSRDEVLTKSRPPRIRKYEFTPQGRSAAPGERSKSTTTTPTTTSPPPPKQEDVGDDYYYETEDEKQGVVAPPPTKPTPKPKPSPPTTLSSRQRFINRNFRQNTAPGKSSQPTTTPTTTTTTTTPKPTTTPPPPPPPPTTQRSQRVTLRSQYGQSTTSTTPIPPTPITTTTTTELPQYEYEYEYEDDVVAPASSQVPLVNSNSISSTTLRVTTPTTTTTTRPTTITTTTLPPPPPSKPSRPASLRSNKRPGGQGGVVQTSTSVSVQEQESSPINEELDDSTNAINRRQSSWRGQQGSQSRSPTPATPPPTPSSQSVQSSTSERVSQGQGRGNRQQGQNAYQVESPRPVITVKSQSPISPPPQSQSQSGGRSSSSSSSTETTVVKNRPSRFWQRPTKVVAVSSSTTEPPVAQYSEYDYSDADDTSESPPPPPPPTVPRYNQHQSRFKSTPSLVPSSTSSYTEPPSNANVRGQGQSTPSNPPSPPQQYLRSTISQSNNQNPYRSPLANSNTNFISQYGPSPSSIGIQYQHSLPSTSAPQGMTSTRPEFISLLRDDEDGDDPYAPYDMTLEDPRGSRISNSYNSNSNNYNQQNRRLPAPTRTQYFGGTGPSGGSGGGNFHSSQKNLYAAAQETFHTFLPPPSRFNFMSMGTSGGAMDDYGPPPPPSSMILYRGNYPREFGKKK